MAVPKILIATVINASQLHCKNCNTNSINYVLLFIIITVVTTRSTVSDLRPIEMPQTK